MHPRVFPAVSPPVTHISCSKPVCVPPASLWCMLPPSGDPQCIPRYLLRCHPCPLGPNLCVCPQYPLNALWFLPVPWLQLHVFPLVSYGPLHTPHCCLSVPQDISYCPCLCLPLHPFLSLVASSSVTHIPCSPLSSRLFIVPYPSAYPHDAFQRPRGQLPISHRTSLNVPFSVPYIPRSKTVRASTSYPNGASLIASPPHPSRLSLPVPGASPRPAPVPSRRIPSPGPAAARGRHGQAVRRAVPPAAARRLGRG